MKQAISVVHEWMQTMKFGKEYADLVRYLPEDDAEQVRQMLQQAIKYATRHSKRPITTQDVDFAYRNLLDSNRLGVYEARAEIFKAVAMEAEAAAAEIERQQAIADAVQAQADAEATLKQSIIDRQKQDAANKQIDIKELHRRALFSERVNGRIQTTPKPASIKVVSRTATPTTAE